MNLKILGSSGSVAPGQNTAAFLIDDVLLLDAGTISLSLDRDAQFKISHIFLTHAHLDHIKGIPFLMDNLAMSRPRTPVKVISGKEVIREIRRHIFNNRIWPDFTRIPSPEHPVLQFEEITPRKPLVIRGYRVYAARVNHIVPAYGYLVEDQTGAAVVYTGDSGPTEDIWKRMTGHRVKALIVEVSFSNSQSRLARLSGHLTPALLRKEIEKMPAVPEKILICHPKPAYRRTIEKELAAIEGIPMEILEDGMKIRIGEGN
ncbi:MAG: 3',5'-cyclic-nucleotide phosphodiesterase [Deltaproteobacteria bacterium]|nr:3',5'-cyclic-nucleotide phosphodiesterase [Deltaproteobacteria bacterium]